jgi:hypothetical protein
MTARLLSQLQANANHRDVVLLRESVLLEALQTQRDALSAGLAELETAAEIRILSPLPFLVLKLKKWSGRKPDVGANRPRLQQPQLGVHGEVPVSSSAAAAAMRQEDGGAGEGEALLEEVLEALGPSADREEFAQVLNGRSRELVRRCLRRVQATKSVRVSKAALFSSLLQRLSH